MQAAETTATQAVAERKSALLPCDEGADGCAEQFVEQFGLRAFRRPLTDDERQAYTGIFQEEGDFDAGMEAMVTAMLGLAKLPVHQ